MARATGNRGESGREKERKGGADRSWFPWIWPEPWLGRGLPTAPFSVTEGHPQVTLAHAGRNTAPSIGIGIGIGIGIDSDTDTDTDIDIDGIERRFPWGEGRSGGWSERPSAGIADPDRVACCNLTVKNYVSQAQVDVLNRMRIQLGERDLIGHG